MSLFSKVQQRSSLCCERRKGSILVMVLIFIVLLSFIVVAFLGQATSKIKYYGLFHNQDDLRTDAYSALEVTLAVINQFREIEGSLWGEGQGWGNPLTYVDFKPRNATNVTVSFSDESGKFSLNTATDDILKKTFDALDFDLTTSQKLTDTLLDWIDEDDLSRLNGFDGEDYEDKSPPYKPANGPITTWDELILIEGFREAFWDEDGRPLPILSQFKSAFSLYHEGQINLNAASPLVINILSEMNVIDPYALETYKSGPDGELGTEDDRLIRDEALSSVLLNAESANVSATIEMLHVTVKANRGDARFLLNALVTWSGSNPSANDTKPARHDDRPVQNEEDPVNEDSAASRRQQARGSAKTESSTAAQLGYPFKMVRLTENRNF